ncbi:pitrilysin family protein [Myxococcus sp. CA040A]|uniref:M16 family metallopeptidase n=1 Tax=Myxococcus sp. CA040A TaxID=2741738 RepID=UPI00157AE529|nr:pitrilysin family protein [Myxococcus sp. CA040A]NTX04349.1 insulinase family protein [Myxococcus sp. CA040A]
MTAQTYTLDNGLTVVFERRDTARAVAFQVWVRAGSADERPDQLGLAHLHEHMLFKGTSRRAPGDIARTVEAHGGQINAWTSYDQTVFHVVIASRFARLGLDILADAVRGSSFDAGELAREIEVVCEEIKRNEDLPARRASRQLFAAAYPQHPYGRPVIGTAASVRDFTRERVLEFYARHYTPRNLVLSLAGDFDESRLRAWVDELFGGDWGQHHSGPMPRPAEPERTAPRICLREDGVKEAWLHLGFSIPDVAHPDVPALDVLALLTGQGERSRVIRECKRRQGLVRALESSSYTPLDPGLFSLRFTLAPNQVAEAVEEELRVLARLRAEPVPAEELAMLQAHFEARAVQQREEVQELARRLGYYQFMLGGLEAEARYHEAIARLTPERLHEVAERYLRFDRAVLTGLLPQGCDFSTERAEALLMRAAHDGASRGRVPASVREGPAPLPRLVRRKTTETAQGVVESRLPSGARVLVLESRAVPLVAMRACFAGGVRYETAETNGLTTLLGRCLTRGTATRDAQEVMRRVTAMAGSLQGAHGRNLVELRGEFLSRHFQPAFRLFADCLRAPLFSESEVARERGNLSRELGTRDGKPEGRVFDVLASTLYRTHPYRLPVSGESRAVARLGPESLRAWHAAYMNPAQMVLSVVGDVRAEEVLARAHELFGDASGALAAPPPVAPEPLPESPREHRQVLARSLTHLALGFMGARVTDTWRHALKVLSTLLAGQGGRLFRELRDKRAMAYSVNSYSMEGVDPGYFAIYMGTSPEKVTAALVAIRSELERVRDERVSEEELERARQHLIGTHELGLQRNAARAAMLAMDGCLGVGQENFQHYAQRVSEVTADHVRDVARRVIDFERSALAVVGP